MQKKHHHIIFCLQAKGRLGQAKKTLRHNFEVVKQYHAILNRHDYNHIAEMNHRKDHSFTFSFVLVDWNCPDHITRWAIEEFSQEIHQGLLRIFHIEDERSYHIPTSKNFSHRISLTLGATYLVNLDIDNFLDVSEFPELEVAAINQAACTFFSGYSLDGTYGRIGLPAELYIELQGYNEALPPAGVHDRDLMRRIVEHKVPLYHFFPKKDPLLNTKSDTIRHTNIQDEEEYRTIITELHEGAALSHHQEFAEGHGTLYTKGTSKAFQLPQVLKQSFSYRVHKVLHMINRLTYHTLKIIAYPLYSLRNFIFRNK